MPESFHRLRDGMKLKIGDRQWRVIIGRGHSPEHACLYCEEDNLLISGDQILPTISSNISVWPTEPAANPLEFWFQSLHMLKRELPEDVLVLPAHGKPFRGAHVRLSELSRDHEDRLASLLEICAEPKRVVDLFASLYRTSIDDNNRIMATGEAVSHLNYLCANGDVVADTDAADVTWYCRS